MSDKITIQRTFNTHFFEFIDHILSMNLDKVNTELMTAKNSFELIRKANPTLIIKVWFKFIYMKYSPSIDAGDITFFFKKDYSNDVKNLPNAADIIKIIDSLREPIFQMSTENQALSMKYIQNLSKLSTIYKNFG
jgi:hypothetical protein